MRTAITDVGPRRPGAREQEEEPAMRQRRLGRLLAATALTVTLAAPAMGADPAMMEAAKKEGKVVWYSSLGLSLAQRVCDAFNKKARGVTCELNRDGSQRIFQRVMQEGSAGLAIADVVHTSDISHFLDFREKGMLLRYLPAGAERFRADFRDRDGLYTVLRGTPYVIGYNTQKVSAAEAPKHWRDLADPRWKGKLVHAHPGYSGVVMTGITGLLGAVGGWDYYAALAKNNPLIVQSAEDPPMKLSGGEAWVGATGEYNLYREAKKGNPVAVVFPDEGVPFVSSANAILAKAPHPNAAKVFTDFLFGKEAQQLLADDGLYVPNEEVTYPKGKRPLGELRLIRVEPEEMRKRDDEIKRKFRELFGV
jgi:iron(III) transport system substrate-binding protein